MTPNGIGRPHGGGRRPLRRLGARPGNPRRRRRGGAHPRTHLDRSGGRAGRHPEVHGTVLVYGHYDKQPPFEGWSKGRGPWTPVIEGDRLYARGVADDGYALPSALLALEF